MDRCSPRIITTPASSGVPTASFWRFIILVYRIPDANSPFWDAPGRNDHAPALWFDGKDTIYQFNGLSPAATYLATLALVMRTSKDSGATWSKAKLIGPEHEERHMPVQSVFRASDGAIVLPSDANPGSTVIL